MRYLVVLIFVFSCGSPSDSINDIENFSTQYCGLEICGDNKICSIASDGKYANKRMCRVQCSTDDGNNDCECCQADDTTLGVCALPGENCATFVE